MHPPRKGLFAIRPVKLTENSHFDASHSRYRTNSCPTLRLGLPMTLE